jgi:hypothetical protein
MKNIYITTAAHAIARATVGLVIQQMFYSLHTIEWLSFSTFTGTQIFFEVMYLLSIVLLSMKESIKDFTVKPIKTVDTSPLINYYTEKP